MTVMFQA